MADIFVSYASEDRERIRLLVEMLERSGFSVWWDRHIATGESFDRVIERELDAASCVVVVWSAASVESNWVRNEANEGLERKVLAPVLIDDVRPPLAFRSTQTANLVGWQGGSQEEAPGRLLADIATLMERPAPPSKGSSAGAAADQSRPAAREVDPKSIAILPFVNRSQDDDDAYFADGLTEELINLLSRASDFRVAARTSAFKFKGTTASIEEVAATLGVAYVMEGSVRKSEDRLRVNAQLIEARSGFQVWSESWEKELRDVFQIQNDIAEAATSALSASSLFVASSRDSVDPRAYELFLRSKPLEGDNAPSTIEKLEQLLTQALAIDPEFADAWSALGTLMVNKAGQKVSETESAFLFAMASFERALQLDPQNVNAMSGLGWIQFYWRWQFEAAGKLIRRAVELAPNNPSVLNTYATWLGKCGTREEELATYRKAAQADPLSQTIQGNLGIACINYGRFAEAEAALRELRAIDENSDTVRVVQGWLALRQERPEEALAEFLAIGGTHRFWGASFAYFDLGRLEESESALATLIEQSPSPYYQVAGAYAHQGRVDEAFEWLERAVLKRDTWLADLRQFYVLEPLRSDPRWPGLLEKVGLG